MATVLKQTMGTQIFREFESSAQMRIVQGSAIRYSESTIFWTSLPSDIALHASCQFFWHFFWVSASVFGDFLKKPDLAPCDFFCTHGWYRFWNGGILLTLQRFNENCWRPLTAFLLKILDNVSSSGSIAGIAVSGHRDSTLKGTKVSNLYKYFK